MEEVPKDNANGSINWIVSARPLDSDNRLSHNNDIVENSLVFGQMQFDGSVQSVEPDDWLSDVLSQSFDHIIFYLHGFNNPPYKKVVKRVHNINGQLHHELDEKLCRHSHILAHTERPQPGKQLLSRPGLGRQNCGVIK